MMGSRISDPLQEEYSHFRALPCRPSNKLQVDTSQEETGIVVSYVDLSKALYSTRSPIRKQKTLR